MKNTRRKGISVAIFFVFAGVQTWAVACTPGLDCGCGDEVTVSGALTIADPIAGAVCPGNGLVIKTDGIELDLRQIRKILGSGIGTGVRIEANNVRIIGYGVVKGFRTGIGTAAGTTGSFLHELISDLNANMGVELLGNNHTIFKMYVRLLSSIRAFFFAPLTTARQPSPSDRLKSLCEGSPYCLFTAPIFFLQSP